MEAVIFIGIQATGKSSFYRHRFENTHVHVNLDTIKTRKRENQLISNCLNERRAFVVDNTNLTAKEREQYINAAIFYHRYNVIGYYFQSKIKDALERNELREGKAKIPKVGILGASARLELPKLEEGFDELYYVTLLGDGKFDVKPWGGNL